MYEKNRGVTAFTATIIGANLLNLGFQGGLLLGEHRENASGRAIEAQQYNEQLHEQLEPANQIGRLIVNDEDKTFTFTRENGETCKGTLRIQDHRATAVGSLACTAKERISG